MPALSEKAWPHCPKCGNKAEEVSETEDTASGHVVVVARCRRCGVEEHLEVPKGYRIAAGMFGLQVVKNGENLLPPRPVPESPPRPAPAAPPTEGGEEKRFSLLEVD